MHRKVTISVLMGLGAIAGVMAIIKGTKTPSLGDKTDYTWSTASLLFWTSIESNILSKFGLFRLPILPFEADMLAYSHSSKRTRLRTAFPHFPRQGDLKAGHLRYTWHCVDLYPSFIEVQASIFQGCWQLPKWAHQD